MRIVEENNELLVFFDDLATELYGPIVQSCWTPCGAKRKPQNKKQLKNYKEFIEKCKRQINTTQ